MTVIREKREPAVLDEGAKQVALTSRLADRALRLGQQLLVGRRGKVGHRVHLDVSPHVLDRIQLRAIRNGCGN
jgi:hypothetical protein